MAFHWRADDGPTLNAGLVAAIFQGIRTSIARKPYIFVIFQGGGGFGPPVPPLDPHMPDRDRDVINPFHNLNLMLDLNIINTFVICQYFNNEDLVVCKTWAGFINWGSGTYDCDSICYF